MNRRIKILFVILFMLLSVPPSNAQGDRVFTVPLSDLQNWSEHVVLFNLNPEMLGKDAEQTQGTPVEVQKAFELIV